MALIFFFLLNVVLITRSAWIFRDEKAHLPVLITGLVVQLSSLMLLNFRIDVIFLGAGIILVNYLTWQFENRTDKTATRLGTRLIGLLCWLIILGLLCSDLLTIRFNSWLLRMVPFAGSLSETLQQIKEKHLLAAFAWITGILLAVAEAHTAIRFFFQVLNLKPREQRDRETTNDRSDKIDHAEYNRGRVIGVIERLMTFFLIFHGAYSALGFLIAAKGMTRFKQLDDRDFAEYFLIGTLMSITFAGIPAVLVQYLFHVFK